MLCTRFYLIFGQTLGTTAPVSPDLYGVIFIYQVLYMLSMQSEGGGKGGLRYSLHSWLSESEAVALCYEYGENPPEYIFEQAGRFYLMQPHMNEPEKVSEVYEDRYRLLANLCQSDISFVAIDDLPDEIRQKVENGTAAQQSIHPSP